jgi:multidrug resistance efflux pump
VHQREVELHKKKLIDEAQLNAGRARLAEARVEVAILEDDQDSVVANLEIIVQGRQRDLDRTSQLRDKKVLSDNDVDEARLALAVARIHLELQRIILIRKGQLQRVLASQRQGIVTQADVGRAQRNLADARERLRLLPGQHTAP